MCREIKERIDADLRNRIIPIWHDESALNWYLLDKNPKLLHPVYSWPEFVNPDEKEILQMAKVMDQDEVDNYILRGEKDPFIHIRDRKKIRIIQRDKNFFGGKKNLRH